MIQQPELGKKIADYRKSKGYTQEELVDKCNLSVRTLQRIESGEVTPRVSTLKLIVEVLELDYLQSFETRKSKTGFPSEWPGQFYRYFTDLFNLKTHTMRKITVLTLFAFALIFGITSVTNVTLAQSDRKAKKEITEKNEQFFQWFNSGQVDSLLGLYDEDACIISHGCGKDYIRGYYETTTKEFKFLELKTTNVSVSDSLAVEKGRWSIVLKSGETFSGEYLSEWKLSNDEWLIVSESSGVALDYK